MIIQIYGIIMKSFYLDCCKQWKTIIINLTPILLVLFFYTWSLVTKVLDFLYIFNSLFFIVFIFIFFQKELICSIVDERYNGYKVHFKINGLKDISYFLGEFTYVFIKLNINIFLLYILFICLYSSKIIVFNNFLLLMFIMNLQLTSYSFWISSIIRNPLISGEVSQLFLFFLTVIPFFISLENISVVDTLIPQSLYINYWIKDYWNKNYIITNKIYLLYSVLWSFISLILYLYLDQVIPSRYGVSKKINFIFDIFKRKKKVKVNINIDINNKLINDDKCFNGIEVKNLTKKFGNFVALDNINLKFKNGEITSLLGHNGAGKSTIFNILCGIYDYNSGKINYNGKSIDKSNIFSFIKKGFCPAEDILFESLTVYQNIKLKYWIQNLKVNNTEIEQKLELIELKLYKNYKVNELSGGNKRKLSILLSLLGNIEMIFLDEPSSNLDPFTRRDIWRIIKKIKEDNKIVILASHFMDEVEYLSDYLYLIEKGKLINKGNLNDFRNIYGTGIKIKIDTTLNKKFELNSFFKNIDNTLEIEQKENITELTLPENYNKLKDLILSMEVLNEENLNINIKNTTLEDIYLNLGNYKRDEKSPELINLMNVFKNIEMPNYNKNKKFTTKVIMMINKRFYFFFNNINQLIVYIGSNWLLFGLHYWMFSDELFSNEEKLSIYWVLIPLICVLFSALNTIYVYYLVYEKQFKLKNFMHLNRISSLQYYIGLIISDIILIFIPFLIGVPINYYVFKQNKNYKMVAFDIYFYYFIKIFIISIMKLIISYIIGLVIFNKVVNIMKYYALVLIGLSQVNGIIFGIFLYIGYKLRLDPEHYYYTIIKHLTGFLVPENLLGLKLEEFNIFTIITIIIYICLYSVILYLVDFSRFHEKKIKAITIQDKNNHNRFGYDHQSISKEVVNSNNNKTDLVLNFNHVAKRYNYKNFTVLNDLSFTVNPKETFTLWGQNGSGKSTILNLILGLIRRSKGNIYLLNKKIELENMFYKEKIGVCLQDDCLWDDFTVQYHFEFYNKIFNGSKNYMLKLVKYLELDPHFFKKIINLSSGNRRKVSLGLSLLNCPKILILDEATCGVDTLMRNKIRLFIKELKSEFNTSILMTTHKMREAELLSDKISLLIDGNFMFIEDINSLYKKYSGFMINIKYTENKSDFQNNSSILNDLNLYNNYEDYNSIALIKFGTNNLIQIYKKCYSLLENNYISDFSIRDINLEDIYIFLTK